MSFKRRLEELLLAVVLVFAAMLAMPSPPVRAATFNAPSLVSYSGDTQAADAYQPAISGDGDDVVFTGSIDGTEGVWEKDLQSGALSLVAGDSSNAEVNAPDAGSPSVSANGEFIAFTSTADLTADDAGSQVNDGVDPDPDPTSGCANVWLRDMNIPSGQPGAYTLVSALNAGTTGIAYAGAGTSRCPGGGSASADRVAISADGNEVAFTVMGESNLTTGSTGGMTTPPDQIAVRYVSQQQTLLVSQTMVSEQDGGTPQPVSGGAAFTTDGEDTTTSGAQGIQPISASTAAISADGSTVAWLGTNVPLQASAASGDAGTNFDEPLWRDIAAGPGSPTRRITGGDDPTAPDGDGPFDEFFANIDAQGGNTGPEYGTFDAIEGFGGLEGNNGAPPLDEATPVLSANGQQVAFLANQPLEWQIPTASGPGETVSAGGGADAYVVNMASGLTRTAALTQLTDGANVYDLAISPDGTRVAFTTTATTFALSSPTLITPPLAAPTALDAAQLYEVDLTAQTISLVSIGYDGNPANAIVETPSFSSDGDTLAFASAATNLVYGAHNPGTNVFTISENTTPAVPGSVSITPAPALAKIRATWAIGVTGGATKTGTARIYVSVPGAGKLTAVGTAVMPVRAKSRKRTVARTAARARRQAIVALTLKPEKAYMAKVRRRIGLYATVRVSFAASGHKTLTKTLQLTLRDKTPAKKVKKKKHKTKKPKKAKKKVRR